MILNHSLFFKKCYWCCFFIPRNIFLHLFVLQSYSRIFSVFLGSAFMKDYVFKLEKYSDATFLQDSIASVVGASASILAAQPLDVIKTRIQKHAFAENQAGGFSIIKTLIKNEGFGAFFKGFTPKLLVVGPKLVFSFTIAQQLMSLFDNRK